MMDATTELLLIASQARGAVMFRFEGPMKVWAIYRTPGNKDTKFSGVTLREAAERLLAYLSQTGHDVEPIPIATHDSGRRWHPDEGVLPVGCNGRLGRLPSGASFVIDHWGPQRCPVHEVSLSAAEAIRRMT